MFDVPTVVVTARRRSPAVPHRPPAPSPPSRRWWRAAPAARVGLRSDVQYTGSGRPPASLDRVAQRLDVGGVAGQLLGAVTPHRTATVGPAPGGLALRHPHDAVAAGGLNRTRSSARCRRGTRAAAAGCPPRPGPGSCGSARRCRRHRGALHQIGVGACSPLTTTPAPRWRRPRRYRPARPVAARILVTTMPAPASSSSSSPSISLDGLPTGTAPLAGR